MPHASGYVVTPLSSPLIDMTKFRSREESGLCHWLAAAREQMLCHPGKGYL